MHPRHDLTRLGLVAALALTLPACSQSHTGPEGGGVCCPVTELVGCHPGDGSRPGGGWAADEDECSYTIPAGRLTTLVTDERGCPRAEVAAGPCGPVVVDAGVPVGGDSAIGPPIDGGGAACDGLAPADCLDAGCVPTFHDSCCSSCVEGGGCADCVHWEPWACETFAHACEEAHCSTAPSWACFPSAPDCTGAHVNALDACDVPGCVPAYPSSEGEPDPSSATCAPIHANVCTVACRRVAPPCPTGTVPEGDGSCYTDRCIPAFVCE